MPLNGSGPISMGGSTAGQSINLEIGRSSTASINLNETIVRTLAGAPSGAVVMPTDFYNADYTGFAFVSRGSNTSTFADTNSYAKFLIETTGNAANWGSIGLARINLAPISSSTRGIWAGGGASSVATNVITYITMDSGGTASDFGDLAAFVDSPQSVYGCSNQTLGLVFATTGVRDEIEQLTIATTGNTTSFGSLTGSTGGRPCGFQSPTRAVMFATKALNTVFSQIQYVTFASAGNAITFGDLVSGEGGGGGTAGTSSSTRGLLIAGKEAPGAQGVNGVTYVTIASAGNAVLFGDMNFKVQDSSGATSNGTRAVTMGGYDLDANGYTNSISYRTISSTGNFLDFGDLPYTARLGAPFSDSHGGL